MTATVGIDPRIKARRIAVQRDAGHRRLRRLQTVGVVIVSFGVAFAITRSPVMDVDQVSVTAHGVDDAALRGVLDDLSGTPLVAVDPQRTADALAALPEVESVRVRRSWPATIDVDVTPSVPALALAAPGGGWLVVDRTGRIMAERDDVPAGLTPMAGVVVDGVVGQRLPAGYRAAAAVGASFPPALRERVADVRVGPAGTIEARLVDGGLIVFGAVGDPGEAAVAAAAVAVTVAPGCVERIDAQSATAPALRLSPAC